MIYEIEKQNIDLKFLYLNSISIKYTQIIKYKKI